MKNMAVVAGGLAVLLASQGLSYEREDLEEPDGYTSHILFNSEDDIYGLGSGHATWIKNLPIYGNYFIEFFHNGIEEATYGAMGLTIRLMPRWQLAPFVGVGGSYNHSFSGSRTSETLELQDQGDSYYAGYAAGGLRWLINDRRGYLELFGRQVSSSLSGDRDYWVAGLGMRVLH
jgi:hypothetical protein